MYCTWTPQNPKSTEPAAERRAPSRRRPHPHRTKPIRSLYLVSYPPVSSPTLILLLKGRRNTQLRHHPTVDAALNINKHNRHSRNTKHKNEPATHHFFIDNREDVTVVSAPWKLSQQNYSIAVAWIIRCHCPASIWNSY